MWKRNYTTLYFNMHTVLYTLHSNKCHGVLHLTLTLWYTDICCRRIFYLRFNVLKSFVTFYNRQWNHLWMTAGKYWIVKTSLARFHLRENIMYLFVEGRRNEAADSVSEVVDPPRAQHASPSHSTKIEQDKPTKQALFINHCRESASRLPFVFIS